MRNATYSSGAPSTIVLGCAVLLLSSSPAQAQYMSISHYADQYGSGPYLATYLSAIDNSTGCDHSDYQMDVWGGSPTDSWSNSVSGTGAGGASALEEDGDYWGESSLVFQCSCAVGFISGGGGSISSPVASEPYRHHYWRSGIEGGNSVYSLEENSQGKRCSHTTLTWPSAPSPNPSTMNDSGLYWSILGNPVACLSVCTAGQTLPVLGPSGPTLGPASCG
jgi:hypothetical protein